MPALNPRSGMPTEVVMGAKRLILVVASILIVVAGAVFLLGRTTWVDKDPGAVVILSETEIAFPTNWFCNPQRFVEEGRTDDEVRVTYQHLRNPESVKLCALGDCGWGQSTSDGPGQDTFEDLDPDACQHGYSLTAPIGDREIIVNGQSPATLDARSDVTR